MTAVAPRIGSTIPDASAIGTPGGMRPDRAFLINGRFYAQATTGVQRYAREITLAMDALLGPGKSRGRLLAPAGTHALPPLDTITVSRQGPLRGHLWEQIVLPIHATAPLLNLCNTGPAVTAGQIVCIHDANVFVQPDSYKLGFRTVYKALLPWLARRASTVTTVSRSSARQIAAVLPVALKDIVVAPNGHEHAFRWDAAASRLNRVMADRRPFVLLLGSRARHKNIDLILDQAEAFAARGLDLVVAGGGADIFARTATTTSANVVHLGAVSDDDLAFLYSRALCLAFPSLTEGFGIPIVEAMALGCPVVSSDRASMPEVCGGAALLASPDDKPAWMTHVAALLHSPGLRTELAARGREQVRKFSWRDSAGIYLDLLSASA